VPLISDISSDEIEVVFIQNKSGRSYDHILLKKNSRNSNTETILKLPRRFNINSGGCRIFRLDRPVLGQKLVYAMIYPVRVTLSG
jgi:hypothetical protein